MAALLWMTGLAMAQEPPVDEPLPQAEPTAEPADTLLLGGRVLAEVWQDASIASVYRSTGLAAAGTFSWRPHRLLSLDGELGVIRMAGEAEQSIQLVPLSLSVCARKQQENLELFAGLGPALVSFVDQGQTVVPGTKPGLQVVAGARIPTDLIDPPMTSTSPVQRADVELLIGRRHHFKADGLNLSAWRVGVGLVVRL